MEQYLNSENIDNFYFRMKIYRINNPKWMLPAYDSSANAEIRGKRIIFIFKGTKEKGFPQWKKIYTLFRFFF